MKKIYICTVLLLFFLSYFLYAENIRGKNLYIISVSAAENRKTSVISVFPDDIIALTFDNQSAIPKKIQIEARISEGLKEYPHAFAIFMYNNVTPPPVNGVLSYSGNSINYFVITGQSRQYIELFLKEKPAKRDILPGTEIIEPKEFGKSFFPIITTVLPVTKGVPNKAMSQKIELRITPFFEENNISAENSTNIATTDISSEIKSPVVYIISPKESLVFLDNIQITESRIDNIKEGEHTILFKLGDYTTSKKFRVQNGKDYHINMLLDIDILEE